MQSLQLCWIIIFLLFKINIICCFCQALFKIGYILDLLEYNRLICIDALSVSCPSPSHQAFGTDLDLLGQIFGLDLLGQSTNLCRRSIYIYQLSMTILFGTDIWIISASLWLSIYLQSINPYRACSYL